MSKFHKPSSTPFTNSAMILYGRHPVTAAIANDKRQINKILCTAENADEIRKLCTRYNRNNGIISVVDRKEIDRILPREAVHQGLAAYVKELEDYTLEDICILSDPVSYTHLTLPTICSV